MSAEHKNLGVKIMAAVFAAAVAGTIAGAVNIAGATSHVPAALLGLTVGLGLLAVIGLMWGILLLHPDVPLVGTSARAWLRRQWCWLLILRQRDLPWHQKVTLDHAGTIVQMLGGNDTDGNRMRVIVGLCSCVDFPLSVRSVWVEVHPDLHLAVPEIEAVATQELVGRGKITLTATTPFAEAWRAGLRANNWQGDERRVSVRMTRIKLEGQPAQNVEGMAPIKTEVVPN